MLNVVIAVSSVLTLALLLLGCRVLATMYRRIQHLERQERDRATLRRIVNTPREEAEQLLEAAPQPERRRCHLKLYRGGGAAAALLGIGIAIRTAAWTRHSVGIATAAGAVAVAGVATTAYITAPRGGSDIPAPTPRITSTAPESPGKPRHTPTGERGQPTRAASPPPSQTSRPATPQPTSRAPQPVTPRPAPSTPKRNVPSPPATPRVPELPAQAGVTLAPRGSDDKLVDAEIREGRLCLHAAVTRLLATKVCAGR